MYVVFDLLNINILKTFNNFMELQMNYKKYYFSKVSHIKQFFDKFFLKFQYQISKVTIP